MNNTNTTKPEIVLVEHLTYLDRLRESGVTNMFGAGPYLESAFGVSRRDAKSILLYWMETFSTRHPE